MTFYNHDDHNFVKYKPDIFLIMIYLQVDIR
jgi:hypothetical protein